MWALPACVPGSGGRRIRGRACGWWEPVQRSSTGWIVGSEPLFWEGEGERVEVLV